jgi:VWFA-related protein
MKPSPTSRAAVMVRVSGLILLASALIMPLPVRGGPFVQINSIDHESDFPNIRMDISIVGTDRAPVSGLNEENILVYEDGYRVNYVKVRSGGKEKEILYFVFSVDSSRSVHARDLERFKKVARGIIESAEPDDMFAVYRFNDEVNILTSFTNNRPELMKSIESITGHGSKTHLLTSIYDSIDLLSRVERHRKAVIVFTDGRDEGSSIGSEDVIAYARQAKVPVFFICVKKPGTTRHLSRISKLTGGSVFCGTSPGEMTGIYRQVKSTLQSRYSVQYKTMIRPDGKAHAVEVRLRFDSLRDFDTREILIKRRFDGIELPSALQVLLILLVLLLIGMLLCLALYFIRRGGTHIKAAVAVPPADSMIARDFRKMMDHDEKQKLSRDRIITPEDPEYVYSRAWLVEKDGPDAGKKFPIFWEEVTLGRDEENGIVIADNTVSLKHAKIREMKGAYYLFDLASDNGTYLNDKKLLRPKPLYDWDELRLGRTVFIFRGSKIA